MPDAIIRNLLNSFNKLTLSLAACPADEMGTGYEYLIGKFADDAGHTAQEFYTNRTVVELMAEILQLKPHESIYDPTCGSGGMLIKSLTQRQRRRMARCEGVWSGDQCRHLSHCPHESVSAWYS